MHIATGSGCIIAVGTQFDYQLTTREERRYIEAREAEYKVRQRALPRKRKPESQRPGPLTWIQP